MRARPGAGAVLNEARPRLGDSVLIVGVGAVGLAAVMAARNSGVTPATTREVHERVIEEHDVALLTVVTVLNKLVDKRLLQRRKHESLFHYEASLTESEFRAQVSRRVMEGILSFGPEALATSFVDVLAERDPVQLEALQKLIEDRLKRGER